MAGLLKTVAGLLFGKEEKRKEPEPEPEKPKVEEPKPVPLPDDEAVKKAQLRSIAEQRRRRGRASTILTSQGDTLGSG